MKTFKFYITEVSRQSSLSSLLFDFKRHSVDDVMIPLGSSIIERLWPDKIRSKVFHITDENGVEQLEKMQKSKKAISAFFNMDSYFLQSGIQTDGGFVAELTGDILVAGPDDLNTEVDKSGRRYMKFQTLRQGYDGGGLGGGAKLGGMRRDLFDMFKRLVDEYDEWIEPDSILGSVKDIKKDPFFAWEMIGTNIKAASRRTQSFVFNMAIKDYLDEMEKVMRKNSKVLKTLFYDYAMNRTFRYEKDKDQSQWDEIVVNNFVVDKIHVTPAYSQWYEDDETMHGFPIVRYDDIWDLERYIQKTTKIKNV
tara:strand:+ start:24 stop:947 length:924 start_codon:yes stop_codon:yes gene_type:complete